MSSYSIYRLSTFPIDVLKKIIDAKNHQKDKILAKEEKLISFDNNHQNKEAPVSENKKSYFEITSIESSSRMSTNLDDIFNRKTGKVIYMNKIRNYTCGRWNVTDFIVPDFTIVDTHDKSVEFVDDRLNVVWTFTNNLIGSARNSKINSSDPLEGTAEKSVAQRQRFTVTTTKSTSHNKLDSNVTNASTDISKEKPANEPNFVVPAASPQPQIETPSVCMEKSNAATSKILNNDLINKNKDLSPQKNSCSVPAPFVTCNTPMRSAPIQNKGPALTAPDSTNASMSSQPDLTRCSKLADELPPVQLENYPESQGVNKGVEANNGFSFFVQDRMMFPNNNSQYYDLVNKSNQKLSKVNLSTILTLSSQIPILNDHILELNNALSNLKIENECLRHEIMRIKSVYRPSNGYNSEIIKSDDDSLGLLLEIIPGKRRIITLTKLLLPEEIEYTSSLKKQ